MKILANGVTWQLWESTLNQGTATSGIMRFALKTALSICIFLLIFQTVDSDSSDSSASASVVSGAVKSEDTVVAVNKTDVLGEAIDANATSLEQHGAAIVGNVSEEKKRSLAIFFILFVIMLATLVVHMLIVSKIHWMPESLAIVALGALIGSILSYSRRDWSEIEALSPDVFFLVLLPPIIFENAYNLNKGYFFSNFVPILTFAIFGTTISAMVIGAGLYILGAIGLIFEFTFFECFAFAAMISAVDPVGTLAIFQAVKVESLLYMLVFGESMLNDAVSIVLAATALRHAKPSFNSLPASEIITSAFVTFTEMFFFSACLGVGIGLLSALLFKHVDLRKTPSLEFALLLIFSYIPYGFAEALDLSGIMAILFCGISMSQFTRHNVSPIAQITFRHTFRTISFVAETSTFAYIGMAFFTIKLNFAPWLIFWSVVLCLLGRACNVFPLAYLVNQCRKDVQISMKNQIIMWFSGMRGAVCFALVLYMDLDKEKKSILLTTVLFLILFTTIFLGGSALPFISFINRCYPNERQRKRRRTPRNKESTGNSSALMMSKTQEMSFFGSDDWGPKKSALDATSSAGRIMRQLFVRKFTAIERLENRDKLAALTKRALASDQMTDSDDVEFGGGGGVGGGGRMKDDVTPTRGRSGSRNSSDVIISAGGGGVSGEHHLLISSGSDSSTNEF
ncbi:Sodium/hydrogen exchanger [Caenorhabditis elegans]|uniref:Sodium/hydrogen exchanger n=2 Tax=Caenorhabditis elegans TaxID=6239 RepID=G5EBN7_CAEEL|nr:Sodium/hydrogen exchanger [Caenorhabditis elegans]AAM18110.1 putative Na-H exchanger isoform 8a [Caenorhabditis elegans]CAA22320.2 Sodium/hydrogen exchanger [Caenorhabditis elegans]|eukprot:NP_001021728.1 Sodium/hydrogen exchanger [Caenorhabditis elegans]